MKSKTLLLSMTLTIAGLFCFDITEALSQMMMSGNMMHEGMSEQMQKGGMMGQGKMMHQGGMMGQGEMMHHGTMAEPSTKGAEMPSGKVVDGVRTIDVEAFQFGYSPNPIVVRTNEKVKLNLTTRDVTHGFGIGELNINVKIKPGETTVVELTAPKPGDYHIHCTVYCGVGHKFMSATLRVLP